jgi:hypothetical protein
MMKRRKRSKANLASSPGEHRSESNRYLAQAQSQILMLEDKSLSCQSQFLGILDAERTMAKASTHYHARGPAIKPKARTGKRAHAHTALDARLEEIETQFNRDCMKG